MIELFLRVAAWWTWFEHGEHGLRRCSTCTLQLPASFAGQACELLGQRFRR